MPEEMMMLFGGAVKALGNGWIEAPLVRFGGPDSHDVVKDFFTAETDFWTQFPAKAAFLYNHGLDDTLKATKLGGGSVDLELRETGEDPGVWMKGQLQVADSYQAAIYKLAEAGKLGTSSGSVNHLVERKSVGGAFHVTSWPIFEASLTPEPAEPRNFGKVTAVKTAGPSFKALLAGIVSAEESADNAAETKSAAGERREPDAPTADATAADPTGAVIDALKALPFQTFLKTMGAVVEENSRRLSWYDNERTVKQGRPISAENLTAMQEIHDGMRSHLDCLKALIDKHTPETENAVKPKSGLEAAYMDFLYAQQHGGTLTL